ncbi:DNA (cytosine-5-)-methyltransferase [Myxosarcina sp. GI1]|uniref:DNA (cytosine-5-)-methyltransferase n=1 Tax=Myxosarcina sp. GI1 TaxID=1541065 RepID=UPI00056CEE86|nr:DNA (cytosine-5-)-methyltransferase [Myxosarcina sp. GI1]
MSVKDVIHTEQSYISALFEQLNPSYSSYASPYLIQDKIKFIDLFAGIGGMRIAFQTNKSQCVFSSEWDKYARQTYQANFGEIPYGDINLLSPQEIPDHDILLAGFPCQPFSSIGKREGFLHQTQGTLFYSIAKILETKKPFCFLLENVPGLVTHDKGKTFQVILQTLDALNYDTRYIILNAARFQLPQIRDRIYIIGFQRDYLNSRINFSFPLGEDNNVYIDRFIEQGVGNYSISKHLQKTYLFKKDDGRPQIVDCSSKIKVKTLVSTYHKIQRLTGTFVRDGETGIRLLTQNECKSIMGFPDNFVFPVSRTQMYRQLGNSVAVPVVKAIADRIYQTISANCHFVQNNAVLNKNF